jgi:transcription initiation factor TFIIH subunit 1
VISRFQAFTFKTQLVPLQHGILRDGAKEPPPPSGEVAIAAAKAAAGGGAGGTKAAAAKYAAREVLQSMNHHAEVVLRGQPTVGGCTR